MAKTFYGGEDEIDVMGGNDLINDNWYLILGIVVVLVAIFFLMRESFSFMKDLPYTSGAGIRYSSVDSSTNRGHSELEYFGADSKLKATLAGY